MFAYCNNSPASNKDKSGTFVMTALAIGVIAGALVGAVVGGFSAAANNESIAVGIFAGAFAGGGAGLVTGVVSGGVAAVALGSLAIGVFSAAGDLINQAGNLALGHRERIDGGEILEAGIVGTVLAPLSFGGSKLVDIAFNGLVEDGVNAIARGVAESVINGINSAINGITRSAV